MSNRKGTSPSCAILFSPHLCFPPQHSWIWVLHASVQILSICDPQPHLRPCKEGTSSAFMSLSVYLKCLLIQKPFEFLGHILCCSQLLTSAARLDVCRQAKADFQLTLLWQELSSAFLQWNFQIPHFPKTVSTENVPHKHQTISAKLLILFCSSFKLPGIASTLHFLTLH